MSLTSLATAVVLAGSIGPPTGCGHDHAAHAEPAIAPVVRHVCGQGDWRDHLPALARVAVDAVDTRNLRIRWAEPPSPPAGTAPPAPADPIDTPVRDARHRADLEADIALGREYSVQVEKELVLSKNQEIQARVKRLGEELALVANAHAVTVTWGDARLNPFSYQFRVVEGKDVNAFSLPGGFIYIYEGLVNYAESDDELAGVLAHEIAHASFRHVATLRREQSRLEAITLPLILLSIFAGGTDATNVANAGMLMNQAIGSGWSVRAEEAADTGGLQYMQLSGLNPVGMLTFMERLAYDDRKRANIDWGIYRTHPPSRDRAENLRTGLKAAGIPLARSAVSTTLRTTVSSDAEGTGVTVSFAGHRMLTFGGPEAAARAAEFAKGFNTFMDEVPKLHEVRGEGASILGRTRRLVTLTDADAALKNRSLDQLVRETVQSIKAAVYDLNYRVWDAY